MLKILVFFVMAAFCACGNAPSATVKAPNDTAASSQTIHNNINDTVVTSATPMVLNGCYQMVLKRDTALLQLSVNDTTVTGSLQYDFFEKDKNSGTLQGVLRNDRIEGDYTFQSEGRTSVQEVVFKIQEGTLLQGFGDVTEQDGKVVFQDKNALEFQPANPFLKVACP